MCMRARSHDIKLSAPKSFIAISRYYKTNKILINIHYHSKSIYVYVVVWCTAYNFVPGGEYTREHTDYLMGFTAVVIGSALFTGQCNLRIVFKSF